jgi:hypothetical protein
MSCVVGLDVSQKTTAICVVDNAGRRWTLAARAVAIEYRWADGHFRSHPAAERIKNVDQAIIGFVGVVLGAVITAGIAAGANYLLVVRKERAEAVKDRLSRANELKTAARLIVDDFFIAQVAATEFVEKKRWVPGTARNFPLDAWQKDREVLARELPLEDWNTVEIAAWAVERFRNLAPVPRSSDEMLETGQPILKDITAGIQALLQYM